MPATQGTTEVLNSSTQFDTGNFCVHTGLSSLTATVRASRRTARPGQWVKFTVRVTNHTNVALDMLYAAPKGRGHRSYGPDVIFGSPNNASSRSRMGFELPSKAPGEICSGIAAPGARPVHQLLCARSRPLGPHASYTLAVRGQVTARSGTQAVGVWPRGVLAGGFDKGFYVGSLYVRHALATARVRAVP